MGCNIEGLKNIKVLGVMAWVRFRRRFVPALERWTRRGFEERLERLERLEKRRFEWLEEPFERLGVEQAPVLPVVVLPPALTLGPNRLFQGLDLYWRSPESGDL